MRIIFRLVVFLLILTGIGTIAAGAYLVMGGLSARETPGPTETFVARRVRALALGSEARNLQNPVPRTPEVVAAGMAHFADHCATCHANDGSGNTSIGQGLFPKPPDMRQPDTQNLTDGELFTIIENGVRFTGMPAFGNDSEEGREGSWHLVHFIRHLPQLTEGELIEMQSLNPAPPDEIRQRIEEERFLKGTDDPAAAMPANATPAAPHKHPR